jgi:hypothetical protein
MFGDERPSCPDLAQIMQDWIKQYRGYVSMEQQVHTNFITTPYITARPSIGNAQVIGWFTEGLKTIKLADKLGKITEELVPEDPMFFQKLDARIEEVIGPSHG